MQKDASEHTQKHHMIHQTPKRIPYGLADYRRMRQDNSYYVDKTRFIPLIEAQPYYLFLIRPRRFGKSLWLSVLQYYYDVNYADEFEALFGDTYIGKQPTADRNSYLVMFFNFSMVNPDPRFVHDSFEDNGQSVVEDFLLRYTQFFDADIRADIVALPTCEAQLRRIFYHADREDLKIYMLIDEYDNFANTILANLGQEAYYNLTHGEGFFRFFFNLLKGATAGQITGLTRLFITGVSPVTMDDVSSGFNIGTNISLDATFNAMVGFTEDETRAILHAYHQAGVLPMPVSDALALMNKWYNNYHFGRGASTSMYNSDMVLYFLLKATGERQIPEFMIDQNVRIDYEKLRHLITIDQQLNGNFSQLKEIIDTGEVTSHINPSFPVKYLHERENFVSLLYYFGLLTFAGEREGQPLLRIPNQTIKDLMYSYIRDAFKDVGTFRLDILRLSNQISGMAYRGEWQSVFDFISNEIEQQTSIRDYLSGEKVVQGFLLAYLNVTQFFLLWPEKEMGDGFVDFYMEPFIARYPDMKYGYLIELKYIQRSEYSDAKLQKVVSDAEKQLARYANDPRIQRVAAEVNIKKLVLVYNGWELVYREESNR